ncbi:MAG: hypothetical protein E2O39_12185 [Planctomycetota bacterium]|nr:MAG: hypothetical protein E2O39_12185 [Planctomycetota bacterium]
MVSEPIRVAIVGARGKMGTFTQGLIAADERFAVAALVASGDPLEERLRSSGADVAIDFTVAGSGASNGHAMLACGVRPLIGTSGVSEAESEALDADARKRGLGGLVVPNFCLGVWLQQRFALEAVRHYPHVEIVEEHDHKKRDAPSGTAADTAWQLAAARPGDARDVPIHSIRIPGLYSNQTVIFGGTGEVLRLTHETYGVDAFGPGILAGLAYTAVASGVGRGIGVAFEQARECAP